LAPIMMTLPARTSCASFMGIPEGVRRAAGAWRFW
jgi:cytochrome P450